MAIKNYEVSRTLNQHLKPILPQAFYDNELSNSFLNVLCLIRNNIIMINKR